MATASIRTMFPGLARAIMALALAVAMIAASVVAPSDHAHAGGFGFVAVSAVSDDGAAPESGHASKTCHGCIGHGATVLSSPAFAISARVTDADLAAGDDASPAMPARVPPVEPPRA